MGGEREGLERGRREKEGRTDATSEKINEREEDPENVMRLEKPLAEFTTNVIDCYGKGWVQAKEGRWTRTEEVEVKGKGYMAKDLGKSVWKGWGWGKEEKGEKGKKGKETASMGQWDWKGEGGKGGKGWEEGKGMISGKKEGKKGGKMDIRAEWVVKEKEIMELKRKLDRAMKEMMKNDEHSKSMEGIKIMSVEVMDEWKHCVKIKEQKERSEEEARMGWEEEKIKRHELEENMDMLKEKLKNEKLRREEMEISNGKLRERLKIMKGRLVDVESELAKTDALLNESQKMSLKLNEDLNILVKERAEKMKRKQEVRERMKRLAENGSFTEETETKEYTLSDTERLSESELERTKRKEKRKS